MSILTFVLLYGLGYFVSIFTCGGGLGLYCLHAGKSLAELSIAVDEAMDLANERCFGSRGLPAWAVDLLNFLAWPLVDTVLVIHAVRLLKENPDTTHKEEA